MNSGDYTYSWQHPDDRRSLTSQAAQVGAWLVPTTPYRASFPQAVHPLTSQATF